MKKTLIHRNKIHIPFHAEAVIFDIDDTLYSSMTMLLKQPFPYIRSSLWLMRYRTMRILLRKHLQKNSFYTGIENNTLRHKSARMFAHIAKLSVREAERVLEKHIYKMWIQALRNVSLRFGMRSLLGTLVRKGVPLGVISDFKAEEKLTQWNITRYFSSIMYCEDYGVLKPAPEVFVLCCKKLHCNPEKTIYVGNSLPYDGIGAQNAALTPVLFHRKKNYIERMYSIPVVNSVKQLKMFLHRYGLPTLS